MKAFTDVKKRDSHWFHTAFLSRAQHSGDRVIALLHHQSNDAHLSVAVLLSDMQHTQNSAVKLVSYHSTPAVHDICTFAVPF